MAIKKDFEVTGFAILAGDDFRVAIGQQSHVLTGSYIKVENVNSTKANAVARVSIVSGETRIEREYGFLPKMEGVNFIAQAYEHLKTLPEFADAMDC